MTRVLRSPPIEADWQAVSEKNPCPICGSPQGLCSGNLEESFVCCARCPSDWLLTNGAWLHPIPAAPADDEPSLRASLTGIGSPLAGSV